MQITHTFILLKYYKTEQSKAFNFASASVKDISSPTAFDKAILPTLENVSVSFQ